MTDPLATLHSRLTVARWRFSLAGLLLGLLMLVLLWHLARLQVLPGEDRGFEFLQGQGEARSERNEPIAAHRGVITDRNGEPLAVSTPVVSLWANPAELSADSEHLAALARALDISATALRDKLRRYAHKEFVYLQRNLSPQDAERVLDNGWPGVYGRTEYQRFYPAGEVTAHVVGFTDIDERGREGVELAFDDWLLGQSGSRRVIKDRLGRVIRDLGLVRAPVAGRDLNLSIDLRMQFLAYKELKQAVSDHRASSGSLVMVDTRSGEILAMVNQPSYNPNNRARIRLEALRNRAVTDQIEPGSTMKPLTVLAAMETGRWHPRTQIDTSPGWIHLDTKTLVDAANYGRIDLTRVLTKSSQVGISKVALDLEIEQIRDMFYRFGLGQGTAIGFPGEGVGSLPSKRRWTRIERANFAFGYGMSVTTLQLAQAYAVIANRGVRKPLSLLRQSEIPAGQRVVDSIRTEQLVQMLKTVVEPEGTASKAQIADYPAAGKTGTVHRVAEHGYAEDRYRSVFAGMAPASDPRVALVVVIEEPTAGKYFGGEVAGPVFSKVAAGALRMMHVAPENSGKDGSFVRSTEKASKGPLS